MVEAVVDRQQLAGAARDLADELSHFPMRGDDPTL
jgi:hypothetical protein